MESKKMILMNLFSGQQWRNRHREQTCEYEGGEDGRGEMYGESNMEIYNTICKVDSQWEYAIWLRELKQGLHDNLEGWDREGDGREFQEGGDMGVPVADSLWCMTENHKIL